ncbi:MAG TPA: FAD-dependent monooxygenase [Actinoplanes sp.]|nr:FAD-dependent monooxygenase [Actinoplanes sp.]
MAYDTDHTGLTLGPLERTDPRSPLVAQQDAEFRQEVRENYALSMFNSTVQALAIRSSVPINAWEPSTVTVVGDAVHAMSPAAGIGANTALRDAHVLGDHLLAAAKGEITVLDAIGAYEQSMREYAYQAVRKSAFIGQKVIVHAWPQSVCASAPAPVVDRATSDDLSRRGNHHLCTRTFTSPIVTQEKLRPRVNCLRNFPPDRRRSLRTPRLALGLRESARRAWGRPAERGSPPRPHRRSR